MSEAAWHLARVFGGDPVALAHRQTSWSVVDAAGRCACGRSAEEALVRVARRRR